MEKITLAPGAWTRLWTKTAFQVAGPYAVRIALGSINGSTVTAPPVDAPYFKTQDYNPNVTRLEDIGLSDGMAVYLRPHGSEPVDVVLLP